MEGLSKVAVREFIRKSFNNGVVIEMLRTVETKRLIGIISRSKGDLQSSQRIRSEESLNLHQEVEVIYGDEFIAIASAEDFDSCREMMTSQIVLVSFLRETGLHGEKSIWPMYNKVDKFDEDLNRQRTFGMYAPPGEIRFDHPKT